jgi:uncharacterized membrane protein YphA (DoxX/SURF4 family)
MAVISYWHVLGSEGYEAALAQHVLWAYMILVLMLCGGGSISLDKLLEQRSARRCRPMMRTAAVGAH